ncbi:serine hydrolase domain-containing protein [Frankia canadensis]|uniref:serine hydrolase domain-containing protein n=1 Tax=Frankia canadensis TaxID=1836972 RepID=UPI001FAF84DF|nr:serine hydrolase domain-containing protein [Frankia canadensis]
MSTATGWVASQEVVEPADAGVDPVRLEALVRHVRDAMATFPLPSAQLAVARGGQLVLNAAFGDTDLTRRYVLQSAGRTVVASIAWQLLDQGLISLDDTIASIIPEFGTNGKDVVTVEQVLTHTAGLPFAPLGYPKMLSHDERMAAFGRWRLTYPPGARLEFHLTSAAWIIAELVWRRTGVTIAEYLRTRLCEPLGLSLELGVPVERQADSVAPMIATDRTSDDQEVDPWGPWYVSRPEILAAGEPSHSLVGTAADVALHYQAVVHSGRWSPEIVAEATRVRRSEAPHGDQLYGGGDIPTHMGLFTTISGRYNGSWLPTVGSPATWGHGGAAYQLGFYDPEADLSVACLTNGYPLSGYDYTRRGVSYLVNLANLAAATVS